MRKFAAIVSVALLAVSPGAFAGHGGSNIDLYYMSSGIEITVPPPDPDSGSADDSGDGFGVKGQLEFAPNLYITGEYQSTTLDDFDTDFDQMRFGIGGRAQVGLDLWGRLRGEYVDAEYDGQDFDDGFAAHAGLELEVDALSIYGDVGYLWLGESDGPEFLIGVAYELLPSLGAFADYRFTSLERDDDSGIEYEFDDFRVGLRLSF